MLSNRLYHAAATAVQFLTSVPVPGGMNRPDADRSLLRSAVAFFPAVGGLIGLTTGTVIWLGLQVWPPPVAVGLGLLIEAILTGGFHEDAVADCCDAFGGGWTRDDVLRILKDSRIGSFGGLGLLLAVGLRAAGLLAIDPAHVIIVVAASGTIGRLAILLLMAFVPPVPNREGLARDIGERIGWRTVAAGSLLAIPGVATYILVEPVRCACAMSCVVVVVFGWGRYVRHRIGGITGDCLGAGCYLAQVVVLLVAAARPFP